MMKQKTTGHRRIPSRLLGVSLLLAGMSLVPVSGPVWAREGATAATFGLVDEAPHTFLRPKQVSLFPTHALVQGEEELEVRVRDGVGRVELFVPENARNLQFDLGDVRLASWRSRVAPAAVADGDARRRQDLLARKRAVEGELEAVSACGRPMPGNGAWKLWKSWMPAWPKSSPVCVSVRPPCSAS